MSDKPIIFSGPMVRAILDGRKTQTRRLLRDAAPSDQLRFSPFVAGGVETTHGRKVRVPYAPGDRLWVREAWCHDGEGVWSVSDAARAIHGKPFYRADGPARYFGPWWSPIHMPRWASRLTLTVTDVRVQRLQEISDGDAVAEGCLGFVGRGPRFEHKGMVEEFRALWNSIHGPDAWEANPWVVALTCTVERRNIDARDDG